MILYNRNFVLRNRLQMLGVEIVVLAMDPRKEELEVQQSCTKLGQDFLDSTGMANDFAVFCKGGSFSAAAAVPGSSGSQLEKGDLTKKVTALFKQKYKDAGGEGSLPYLKAKEGYVTVHGLPDGIELKKPNLYGAAQMRRILNAAETISFEIGNLCDEDPTPASTMSDPTSVDDIEREEDPSEQTSMIVDVVVLPPADGATSGFVELSTDNILEVIQQAVQLQNTVQLEQTAPAPTDDAVQLQNTVQLQQTAPAPTDDAVHLQDTVQLQQTAPAPTDATKKRKQKKKHSDPETKKMPKPASSVPTGAAKKRKQMVQDSETKKRPKKESSLLTDVKDPLASEQELPILDKFKNFLQSRSGPTQPARLET